MNKKKTAIAAVSTVIILSSIGFISNRYLNNKNTSNSKQASATLEQKLNVLKVTPVADKLRHKQINVYLTETVDETVKKEKQQETNRYSELELFPQEEPLQPGDSFYVRADKLQKKISIKNAHQAKELISNAGKTFFSWQEADDIQLETSRRDGLGNFFYKFDQTYQGLPVYGKQVILQTQLDKGHSNNNLVMVSGQFETQIKLSTQPGIDATTAVSTSMKQLTGSDQPDYKLLSEAQLIIFTDEKHSPVLTYEVTASYENAKGSPQRNKLFIDANSGELINSITTHQTALERKVYTLDGACIQAGSSQSNLPGNPASIETDEHAKALNDHMASVYWFYKHMFNRDSWDNQGIAMVGTVHALFSYSSNSGCDGDNGMFDPTLKQIIFGEGGDIFDTPASALDFVGHEFTHGFTSSTSNLSYQNQSGALNEAISDIFGNAIEAWVDAGGNESGNPLKGLQPHSDTWKVFEDTAKVAKGQRIMNDPTQDGMSKDTYSDRYTGTQDSGGVHINSGIINLAFYLLSEGGSHPRGVTNHVVKQIDIEKALHIFYYANEHEVFSSATSFKEARFALAQSAENLYGTCSQEWHSLHTAFDAVEIPGDWTACDTITQTTPTDIPNTDNDTTEAPIEYDLALHSAHSSSSQYNSSYSPANATDEDMSTHWVSRTIYNTLTDEWIELDLGSTQAINSLTIYWNSGDNARSVNIAVWDGSSWINIGSDYQTFPGNSTQITFPETNAQHILVSFDRGSFGRWYAISEIKLNQFDQ
ncbi:MAG: M4 family metallopeptidase [Gammaproteobacteria bacterium]|nr:M4 family metallopeptidase [Gammaproteobacteria bacterium]